MSTLLFSINPGDTLEQVTVASGPAITTKYIELNIDLGNDVVDANSTVNPRPIGRGEIIEALVKIQQAVYKNTSLPD